MAGALTPVEGGKIEDELVSHRERMEALSADALEANAALDGVALENLAYAQAAELSAFRQMALRGTTADAAAAAARQVLREKLYIDFMSGNTDPLNPLDPL